MLAGDKLVYYKQFDSLQSCDKFKEQFQTQQTTSYFMYQETGNNKDISKVLISETKKQKLSMLIQDQPKPRTKPGHEQSSDEYTQAKLSIYPYRSINKNTSKYWLEKSISYQQDNIQFIFSLLYKINDEETFLTIKEQVESNKNFIPSRIFFYIISDKETDIQNFIQRTGSDKQNYVSQKFLQDVADDILFLGKTVNKFSKLTYQVIGLDKKTLLSIIPDLNKYKYTVKTDGMHSLLILDEKKNMYLLQSLKQDIFQVQKGKPYTVFDCEEYPSDGPIENRRYHIFDVLVHNGVDMMNQSYTDRLKKLDTITLPKNCLKKQFFPINSPKDLSIAFQREYKGVKIDGVILNRMDQSYQKTVAYKLKNKKYLTNDFLVKIVKPSTQERQLIGMQSSDVVYKLYVGGNIWEFNYINNDNPHNNQYQPMLFGLPYFKQQPCEYMIINSSFIKYVKDLYDNDPEVNQVMQDALNGKYNDTILECAYDDLLRPYPIRYRHEKTQDYKNNRSEFGNSYNTTLSNYQNVMDPITLEFIQNPINNSYFNTKIKDIKEDDLYQFFREFGRHIRGHAFNQSLRLAKQFYDGQLSALDYGAGRNADYYNFINNRFNLVIAYEPDVQANIEYYSRIKSKLSGKQKMPLTYIVNQKHQSSVQQQLSVNKINYFQSNYAFHYLCGSADEIKSFKRFLLNFSQKKAVLQITGYDGRKFFNLMQKNNGTYDNGKYFIQLAESSSEFKDFGQKINIKMPWLSNDMYQEYLININAVRQIFQPQIKFIRQIEYTKLNVENFQKTIPDEDKPYLDCLITYIFQIQL